jgi:hypothetical protein
MEQQVWSIQLARQSTLRHRVAERHPGDGVQRPLRSRFPPRLTRGVDMIDIANGCAKRTYKSDFWRNRCVNHSYFLICTQGKS